LKLVVLLYADDTILFAKTEQDLISVLNTFSNYCQTWKLNTNFDKTTEMVFGDKRNRNRNITEDNHVLEIVDTFKYLGVVFSKNRQFAVAKKPIVEQARRAMFCLYKKIRNLDLPIDCQLKLFDHTIVPILTYWCEVWGYGDLSLIEKVHTYFLKYVLHVKKSTPHVMVYGELGRFTLSITIKKRIAGYWYDLVNSNSIQKFISLYMKIL
jgi:hypothetical protein